MNSTPPTLLDNLRSGDNKHAWELFHKLYGQRIWAKANQLLGRIERQRDWSVDGHEFVADVCQETVLKVFLHLPTFVRQGPGSFRLWLDTIVRNEMVNELRKPKRRPKQWSDKNVEELCAQLADRDDFHVFTKDEHNRHLVGIAMDWLKGECPGKETEALLRLIKGDANPQDIAQELETSVQNVYLLKHRLLKKLREYMNQYLHDFLD